MGLELRRILMASLFLILVIVALVFVCQSRNNPHVMEIIIGTVLVSVVLGALSSLMQRIVDKQFERKPGAVVLLIMGFLIFLIAFLVLISNKPPSIRREIAVTYLVDPRTRELGYGLAHVHNTTTASACYMEARSIFKKFKEQKPQDANMIDLSLEQSARVDEGWNYFQNLTEFLIPYYISGGSFMTPEADRTAYYREIGDWWGYPDMKIRGKSLAIESIAGDFKDNVFRGIHGNPWWGSSEGLTLPKCTSVRLVREREEGWTSKFIIKDNKNFEIVIGVRLLPMESQSIAYIDGSDLLPSEGKWEDVKVFRSVKTVIHYDVTFNRLRYGFPAMRYYERWANSLFSFLQRCFAWGDPPVLDDREVRSLMRQYHRQTKEE